MWSCKIFIEGYRSVLITYTDEIRAHSCDESLKFRERLKAIASNLFTWHASRFVRFGNWPPFIKYKLWRVCSNAFHIMHTCMLHAWSFEAAVWEILFRIKRLPDFQPSRASLNFCQVVTYSWMSLTVLPVAAVILCICVCVYVSKTSNFLAVWTNLPETFESDRMDPDAGSWIFHSVWINFLLFLFFFFFLKS